VFDGSTFVEISGGGDVVGPGSATDHAIVRFHEATGKIIQNSAVFIDDNGKVGIGTASPDELLHILSAAGTHAVLLVAAPNQYDASLQLFEGTGFGFEFYYNGGEDKLHLWSRKFAGNDAIRMTWMKDGRVGIGTQTPATLLDVAGDITVSGTVDGVDVAAHNHEGGAGEGVTLSLGEAHVDLLAVHEEVIF
jgi:hypothetical protein